MAKNDYQHRRDVRDQTFFEAGRDVGFQQCLDFVFNALREPQFIGEKNVWGETRLVKLHQLLSVYYSKFSGAWDIRNKEAELLQRELDARLKEGLPHYYAPFMDRYPYMKDIRYDKSMRGWTD